MVMEVDAHGGGMCCGTTGGSTHDIILMTCNTHRRLVPIGLLSCCGNSDEAASLMCHDSRNACNRKTYSNDAFSQVTQN